MPEAPTLTANDDDGRGFDVTFEAPNREPILHVIGANVTNADRGDALWITLRSALMDFENDYLYLLSAKLVPGKTMWCGLGCVIDGVLTEFLWRTEEEIAVEAKDCPSGDGIYLPKEPLPGADHMIEWNGLPSAMMKVQVTIRSRNWADVPIIGVT